MKKPSMKSRALAEYLAGPSRRDRLQERKRAIQAFIANRGPRVQELTEREQKRAHGSDHKHGRVLIYR